MGIFGTVQRVLPLPVEGCSTHLVVFHRTSATALPLILRDGFIDSDGWRTSDGRIRRGVWLSALPLGDAPYDRDIVLPLHAPAHLLSTYEYADAGLAVPVWCVPAAELNPAAVLLEAWQSTPMLGHWPGRLPQR